MPDGTHFRKPEDTAPAGRIRRWWPIELGALIAAALVVAIVVIVQSGGQSPSHGNQRPPSRPASLAATGQSPAVAASTTTATSLPNDPYLQPGGSALPVLVVFNGGTITIQGAVPSPALGERLELLAEAYSETPNAKVTSNVVVDPRVPSSTGVRVIEMDAVRFASGSSQITPDYAPQLGRVMTLLKTMPQVTALVIGHADQTGQAADNLSLSYARAEAVVEYLVSLGINPDRLTAQGVGSTSPLTQQTNAAGLALNRRTEFIFYGLLATP